MDSLDVLLSFGVSISFMCRFCLSLVLALGSRVVSPTNSLPVLELHVTDTSLVAQTPLANKPWELRAQHGLTAMSRLRIYFLSTLSESHVSKFLC